MKDTKLQNWCPSNGWLHGFKKRHGLKLRVISGESGGYDHGAIEEEIPRLVSEIERFELKDVYNMDETALLFRNLPGRTIASSGPLHGSKRLKDRVTLALVAMQTGRTKERLCLSEKQNGQDALSGSGMICTSTTNSTRMPG